MIKQYDSYKALALSDTKLASFETLGELSSRGEAANMLIALGTPPVAGYMVGRRFGFWWGVATFIFFPSRALATLVTGNKR